jgi:hypothetical protein
MYKSHVYPTQKILNKSHVYPTTKICAHALERKSRKEKRNEAEKGKRPKNT